MTNTRLPPYISEVEEEEEDPQEEEEEEEREITDGENIDYDEDEDPFTQILLSSEGETIPDVLIGIRGSLESLAASLDKHTKILFKIANHLTK
jgi:hypothetical protein